MADGGYDVADFEGVDPRFGTVQDAQRLIDDAHAHGLRVLLDLVPCHTSIEHPWFREHPERYVWSGVDGPANNWRSTFGGPAWSPDPHGRGRGWYLHSFYAEQPDLDWRHPDVAPAVGAAIATWRARGVDGFRLDALDRLLKDPQRRDDPPAHGPPPLPEGFADVRALEHRHSRNAPDIATALAQLRAAAGDDAFLVGEVYLPSRRLGPYLEHLDTCFAFELLHAPWTAASVRRAIAEAVAAAPGERMSWVLSNHDFPRLPDRVGREQVRAAALLLLSLPGHVFVFQGDELGLADGPGSSQPDRRASDTCRPDRCQTPAGYDRAGRDPHRHPIPWEAGAPHAGFTTGEPWLAVAEAPDGPVDVQARDPTSMLGLYRRLIAARRDLRGPLELLDAADGVVAFTRGAHVVAVNVSAEAQPAPRAGAIVVHTDAPEPGGPAPTTLVPGEGFVASRI